MFTAWESLNSGQKWCAGEKVNCWRLLNLLWNWLYMHLDSVTAHKPSDAMKQCIRHITVSYGKGSAITLLQKAGKWRLQRDFPPVSSARKRGIWEEYERRLDAWYRRRCRYRIDGRWWPWTSSAVNLNDAARSFRQGQKSRVGHSSRSSVFFFKISLMHGPTKELGKRAFPMALYCLVS